jgi:hypothetical protein
MNRTVAGLITASLWVLSSPACAREKAVAVLIVGRDDQVAVMGSVEFVNEGGTFRPNVWKAGNVVVFRVDGTLGGQPGKAGKAYRINKESKLKEMGSGDLGKSDDELAAAYGVKSK